MSYEILQDIIDDFSPEKFIRFFRDKNRSFTPEQKSIDYYNDKDFIDGKELGKIAFARDEKLIVCSFEVNKDLIKRSGKKAQYEKGRKILKEQNADSGIFIFYDPDGNFRFSLIYTNPSGKRRNWSTFRRFTYFVSKDQTNKTFLQRIGGGDFSSIENVKDAFSVEPVTKQFYNELQTWYLWAMDEVEFPDDEDKDRENRNAKNLIRLITRIIFVWFMKEKKLIPPTLFDKKFIDSILNFGDKTGSTYYKAVLQNLFFATLNTPMKKDDPRSRIFVDEVNKFLYKSDAYMQSGYYRYKRFIKNTDLFLHQFENIPFLNGGLFDCLDKRVGANEIRIDCFSDNPRNESRLKVPDKLFFLEDEIDTDLGKHLNPSSKKQTTRKVKGLIPILKSYNFTIDENTPIDEEIALDPELLGKVFEKLLASYNPETAITARKSTGSYYTPREIVEYMVDESLIAYLKNSLSNNHTDLINSVEFETNLRSLFDYNTEKNPFNEEMTQEIIDAIENIKILDPACGSGAFPMGILRKLVLALHKLDENNIYWKERLLKKIPPEIREDTRLSLENKPLGYIHKLGLIEHCIYGVDIQEIAVQISKLRFFISLLVEQEPDDNKPNRDIKSLPNLETKFIAANTLIGLEKLPNGLVDSEVSEIIKKMFKLREDFFYANSRQKKNKLKEAEGRLKTNLFEAIKRSSQKINEEKIQMLKLSATQLNKELDILESNPDKIEAKETRNLFGGKETKMINVTQEKIKEIKREKFACEQEIEDIKNPVKNPITEIAEKIADFNPYDQNKSNSWFDPEWMFGIKDGFDIVIANPPYVRQEKIKEQKPFLRKAGYKIYDSRSDLYTYFYEKSWNILKPEGILCFISSNKWMRAKYGEKLRKFLKKHTEVINLIDFGGYPVFEATVDTNIILFKKKVPDKVHKLNFVNVKNNLGENLNSFIEQNQNNILQKNLDDRCWTLADEKILKLKEKIERIGKPLKDWDVKIYRGVLTGFNEAFIVDNETKERLCREDPKSAEILKPILRGRDIGRYYYRWAGLWVIATFPALHLNIDNYPAVKKYLLSFGKDRLEQSGKTLLDGTKARKRTTNKWFETQDTIAYYSEFEKEKIVWEHVSGRYDFAYTPINLYLNNALFMITGKSNILKYIIAILNSKFADQLLLLFTNLTTLGRYAYGSKEKMEQLPIPKISEPEQKPFIDLVNKILSLTQSEDYLQNSQKQAKVKEYERQIDRLVYRLYGLTDDQIKIVE